MILFKKLVVTNYIRYYDNSDSIEINNELANGKANGVCKYFYKEGFIQMHEFAINRIPEGEEIHYTIQDQKLLI